MSITVLRWADHLPTPWKNGSGSTREVAAAPPGSGLADFDWRVSIADVEAAGPFSAFPGVNRVIMLVDGHDMLLTVDGTDHRLTPARPFAFSGDTAVSCRLPSGPTRDINVMTRQGRTTATMSVLDVQTHRDIAAHPDETLLVIALSGQLTVPITESNQATLERLDAVRLEEAGEFRIRGHGTLAEIRITPTH
ncbi:HutD family protein [Streptomyces sp. NPDC127033]|uniref:HutD/Ves family protein n=1 Tax=Streptomyces sp. NPDC127033 TaxID=3347110 RepID=UPI00365A5C67